MAELYDQGYKMKKLLGYKDRNGYQMLYLP